MLFGQQGEYDDPLVPHEVLLGVEIDDAYGLDLGAFGNPSNDNTAIVPELLSAGGGATIAAYCVVVVTYFLGVSCIGWRLGRYPIPASVLTEIVCVQKVTGFAHTAAAVREVLLEIVVSIAGLTKLPCNVNVRSFTARI